MMASWKSTTQLKPALPGSLSRPMNAAIALAMTDERLSTLLQVAL